MELRIRRIYDDATPEDGIRILVDRLWPRGVSRERAALDAWIREVAPSDALRRWYHENPDAWEEFVQRYCAELETRPEALGELRSHLRNGPRATLLYASKQPEHNNAKALKIFLERDNARLR